MHCCPGGIDPIHLSRPLRVSYADTAVARWNRNSCRSRIRVSGDPEFRANFSSQGEGTTTHHLHVNHVLDYLKQAPFEQEVIDSYQGRTVLVTGGAGAIGSNLSIALSNLVGPSGKIVILDNLSATRDHAVWNIAPLPNILFVRGDVRSDTDLKRVFREDPSIVFHLAAFFANQNSVDYPETAADVDVIGMIRLLEYARIAGIERFVYASSGCAIYGSYPELPLREEFVSTHLTTPYQINKMTGEMYCNFYHHHYGMKIVNCRFFNSYGPGEIPGQYRNVIPNFIYWAMKKRALPITGDGNETRDFTYTLDLVQGLLKAAYYEEAVGVEFNLAAGREIRIADMAALVNRVTENPSPIEFRPRRRWDTKPRLLASIERAQRLMKYQPIMGFEDGFQHTMDWFKANWDRIEAGADFPPGMNSAVR